MKLYHGTNFSSAANICVCGIDFSKIQKHIIILIRQMKNHILLKLTVTFQ